MTDNHYRIEHDLIGSLKVPADRLYGIQTQRALELYPLCGEKPLSAYPELVTALLLVKKVAAKTNVDNGELDREYGEAILNAIALLLEDLPLDQFPVHAFHGGGGISTNMNINEVIANLANKKTFGKPLGSYDPIHPNDHVNFNHSTCDALVTASHLSLIHKWQGLEDALTILANTFDQQGNKWREVLKISRTCLQDAVEITFEDFFSGYSSLIKRNRQRLDKDISELYKVSLGANIIGRRGDCSDAFFDHAIDTLNTIMNSNRFQRSDNLFDSTQNQDDIIAISGRLDLLSRGLLKIAKDFRLLSSGPETGFGELSLPAVQPGSSAMPGKVNPTIPEFLVQCCIQTSSRCHAVQMTQDHGELDYNAWQAIVINNTLDAMSCIENGIRVFTTHCLAGIEPDLQRNKDNVNTLIPTLIRLKKAKGYSFASKVFKESGGDLEIIRRYLEE